MKHCVIIALGSNKDAANVKEAMRLIKNAFHDATFTPILQTAPIGNNFSGTVFYNAVMSFSTDSTVSEIECYTKCMESKLGNTEKLRTEGVICMDIDILQYDGIRFHLADWDRPYIKALTEMILKNNKNKYI